MFRSVVIGLGKFFERTDFYALLGTFLALLGVILPLIPNNNLTAFFSFNDASQLISYIARMLLIFVAAVCIFQVMGRLLRYWGRSIRIAAEVTDYLQEFSVPKYFSLKIVNNFSEDMTDCVATMTFARQHYNPNTTIELLELINPNGLPMSWGGGGKREGVTIPRDGGTKVLNIAYSSDGGRIVFVFDDWKAEQQLANVKYHVSIKIEGRLEGEPFRSIKHEACFRAVNYITAPAMIESYRNDEFVRSRQIGGEPATRFEFLDCDKQEP